MLSIAKLRLADVLDTEHKAVGATKNQDHREKMIFADALALFQEQQKISTEIKERSKEYNQRCADALLKTWKGLETLDIKRITKQDCLRWRAEFGNRYGATTTNGTLSILRRVFDIAVDTGARYDNPARMKEVKRARVRRKERNWSCFFAFLGELFRKATPSSMRNVDSGCCDAEVISQFQQP